MNADIQLAFSSLFCPELQVREGMVLPIFKMYLPTSINLIYIIYQTCIHVSKVIIDTVKMTMNIKHHNHVDCG